jgi:hypothetical protein
MCCFCLRGFFCGDPESFNHLYQFSQGLGLHLLHSPGLTVFSAIPTSSAIGAQYRNPGARPAWKALQSQHQLMLMRFEAYYPEPQPH